MNVQKSERNLNLIKKDTNVQIIKERKKPKYTPIEKAEMG